MSPDRANAYDDQSRTEIEADFMALGYERIDKPTEPRCLWVSISPIFSDVPPTVLWHQSGERFLRRMRVDDLMHWPQMLAGFCPLQAAKLGEANGRWQAQQQILKTTLS